MKILMATNEAEMLMLWAGVTLFEAFTILQYFLSLHETKQLP